MESVDHDRDPFTFRVGGLIRLGMEKTTSGNEKLLQDSKALLSPEEHSTDTGILLPYWRNDFSGSNAIGNHFRLRKRLKGIGV